MLHTPLMSGTNAIHGIVIVGAHPRRRRRRHRLLDDPRADRRRLRHDQRRRRLRRDRPHAADVQAQGRRVSRREAIELVYLLAIIAFVVGLKRLSSPGHRAQRQPHRGGRHAGRDRRHARRRGRRRATGRSPSRSSIGAVIGVVSARAVKMTAMPQMVALFNGVGGGARGADRAGRVPPARAAARARAPLAESIADRALARDRLRLVRGQHDRLREAAGADRRPPDHLSARRSSSTPRSPRSAS